MRISTLLMVSCLCSTLLSCASVSPTHQQATQVAKAPEKKKDPIEVSLYPNGKNPNNPYTVIGIANVSQYNKGGIKRQTAIIHDAMRTLAAGMGGDAVIDVRRTNKSVIGKVIEYQPSKTVA